LISVRNGGVLIKSNPQLCYVDTVHWELIQSSSDQKLLVAGNANSSQCGKLNRCIANTSRYGSFAVPLLASAPFHVLDENSVGLL